MTFRKYILGEPGSDQSTLGQIQRLDNLGQFAPTALTNLDKRISKALKQLDSGMESLKG